MYLDRWQRAAIFSIELGESRWWREPPERTEIFDIGVAKKDAIRAWYLPHANAAAPTVLYLHGSRWNLNSSVFRIERLAQLGFSVLAIDYRGFGESSPILPSEFSATQDALAALDELQRRQPHAGRRFVYGHSLGGAVAVALATQADKEAFAGLILESTFTSTRAMIAHTRYGSIPGLHLFVTQSFDSLSRIKSVKQPILFLHGTNDNVIPHTMSDALFAAASANTASVETASANTASANTVSQNRGALRRLVKIEGASHSGASRSGTVYEEAIMGFIAECCSTSPSGAKKRLRISDRPNMVSRLSSRSVALRRGRFL